MGGVSQTDLARHIGVDFDAIGWAARTVGRSGDQLTGDVALLILTASELADLGHFWPEAVMLVFRFRDEIAHVAFDPQVRRRWIVSYRNENGTRVQMTAVSESHLANIIDCRSHVSVQALHPSVLRAAESLYALERL